MHEMLVDLFTFMDRMTPEGVSRGYYPQDRRGQGEEIGHTR